jgi:hypothetical protein
MGRWANRVLFSILIAIAVVPCVVMLASAEGAGAMVLFLGLFIVAATTIDRIIRRNWMALECLPPYSREGGPSTR